LPAAAAAGGLPAGGVGGVPAVPAVVEIMDNDVSGVVVGGVRLESGVTAGGVTISVVRRRRESSSSTDSASTTATSGRISCDLPEVVLHGGGGVPPRGVNVGVPLPVPDEVGLLVKCGACHLLIKCTWH
jgi:hypothetical protein